MPAARGVRPAVEDGAHDDVVDSDIAEGGSGAEAGAEVGGSAGGSDSSSSEASYIDEGESDSHSEPNTDGGSEDGGSGCVTPLAAEPGSDDLGAASGEPVDPPRADGEPSLPPPLSPSGELLDELEVRHDDPDLGAALAPPAADFERHPKRARKAAAGVICYHSKRVGWFIIVRTSNSWRSVASQSMAAAL